MKKLIAFITCIISLNAVAQKTKADILIHNATIYTLDEKFSKANALVVAEGKIVEVGDYKTISSKYDASKHFDAKGKFIYPGFIDAHAHFVGYGNSLQIVDLTGTSSWEEVLQRCRSFKKDDGRGWLTGRGWDQNDWENKSFPDNKRLNELYPDRPVLLVRIDGHAAIANDKALQLAGIKAGDKLVGGDIEVKDGKLTGILIDNAINIVEGKIPAQTKSEFKTAVLDAQKNCFAMGLTTVDDCGLNASDVEWIKQLQADDHLKMRLYVMLSDSKKNFDYLDKKGIIKTEKLHVRGFKLYGDGALGSRGACLLEPYNDKPGHYGFLLSNASHFDSVANWISKRNFQMCTHAIGDSGNRTILNIYGKYLKGKNDKRWRIEHAQVVNENDFDLFEKYSIIPSVQPTHATSDMYWAGNRLGKEREKGAYAFKRLKEQNGWLPLGTDFPVEDISPFKTFYAAIARKDSKEWPEGGYQMENALSRKDALRGMTIWAARANFEEKEKGSLEPGKFADLIILDQDIMTIKEQDVLNTKVLLTMIGGEVVFER